jgi:hypothetical protein
VKAKILVLEEHISEKDATDMLWRRETRQEGGDERYETPSHPDVNTMLVRRLENFEGLDAVLYVEIEANIPELNPRKLAELAILSTKSDAGSIGRDGITYLICTKENGVETPLMPEYEREILRIVGTGTLERAREMLVG